MNVLEEANCLQQRVLKPAILSVLAKEAARARILIDHLADYLLQVRVELI